MAEVIIMKVILNETINSLGIIGSEVRVADGYARNFLLPRGLAIPVTRANRKQIEADNEAKRKEAEEASGGIDGRQIVLIRASRMKRSTTAISSGVSEPMSSPTASRQSLLSRYRAKVVSTRHRQSFCSSFASSVTSMIS